MFSSEELKKFINIQHGFFTRKNGFSKGLYESLNCGLGSKDKKENVIKNQEIVSNKIGCKKEFLITLNQKHSNKVIYFKEVKDLKNRLEGDAIVTQIKDIGISILTADCAPILFYDPKKKIIGCAHAGWKGALNGIIQNTIMKFKDLGSNNEDIVAAVGPCINKNNYEVDEKFFQIFCTKDKNNKQFFFRNFNNKYNFDLRGFINKEIFNLSIKNIDNIKKDTFSEEELFYSYRRSCFNKELDYGRCISVILMT